MESKLTPLKVLAAGAAWRLFGSRRSAETLLAAVSGDDEQSRMLAGISLVRAGSRTFELIERKIEAGTATAPVVRLLADIDERKARPVLENLAVDETGDLRIAAQECIALLDRIEALEREGRAN